MASYKIALERLLFIEHYYDKNNEDIFNSDLGYELFSNIWLTNQYYLIKSQNIANKLFECSVSLSKNITNKILEEVLDKLQIFCNKSSDVISKLNILYDDGFERKILYLLMSNIKDQYINIINSRIYESKSLQFYLFRSYL